MEAEIRFVKFVELYDELFKDKAVKSIDLKTSPIQNNVVLALTAPIKYMRI